jgi:hypothetical protein
MVGRSGHFTAACDYAALESVERFNNSRCHSSLLRPLQRQHRSRHRKMESAVVPGERDATLTLRNLERRLRRRDPVPRRHSSNLAAVVAVKGQG